MISDLIERWFHEHLELSYKDLKENHKISVCTSEITAQFLSAARYGEKIRLSLSYKFIENYQICLSIEGAVARIKKFKAEVLVRFSEFETETPVNAPKIIFERLSLLSAPES